MGTELMNDTASPYGESVELDYKGKPIRALMVHMVPWFSLTDVCAALGIEEDLADHRSFPAFARMTAAQETFPEDTAPPEDTVLLSPVGVWYLTDLMANPGQGQGIAAWAKRETKRLCPDPVPGDPAVFLTLLEVDGRKELPPFPWKYSGRRSEYYDLKYGAAYQTITLPPRTPYPGRRILTGKPGEPAPEAETENRAKEWAIGVAERQAALAASTQSSAPQDWRAY